jgi:hypothetical protein
MTNRTLSIVVGISSGVPLTLFTSIAPDASKFRVFGCIVFAEVLDSLGRKLDEKAFRGVMDGYPSDALGYRVYNPLTRRITTSVCRRLVHMWYVATYVNYAFSVSR